MYFTGVTSLKLRQVSAYICGAKLPVEMPEDSEW